MNYRSEIDGLRAIAVLPVILFHAGVTLFRGGFVGVDVFFVISGYLITTILIAELQTGKFSIARFYERRARRILPALFVVMLATVPFAWAWMLPSQLEDYAASLFTATLSLSNIYFLSQVDYFAPAAELQPLLHTWSLGVEEQYYLIFPAILMLVWRFGRGASFAVVIVLSLASLALSEWALRIDAGRNFFFTGSRFWEIGAGSICAFWMALKPQKGNSLLGVTGLGLVLFSILYFDASTPFPSVATLVPVLGTALIILFAQTGTWAAMILSARVLVGVGLISYSAYLWHQPLFVFARLRSIDEPSSSVMMALAFVALGLAYLTWRFVEQPFRRGPRGLLPSRRAMFAASGLVALVFLAFGLGVYKADGVPTRLSPDLLRIAKAEADNLIVDCSMEKDAAPDAHPMPQCLSDAKGDPDQRVMLIGDSHAGALSYEFGEAVSAKGIGHYTAFAGGCLPLPGFQRMTRLGETRCADQAAGVLDYAHASNVQTVVISARFVQYVEGGRFDNDEGGREPETVTSAEVLGPQAGQHGRKARVMQALETELRKLAQERKIVLVYPIPEAGWNVPQRLFKLARFGEPAAQLSTAREAYLRRSADVIAMFDRIVREEKSVFAARVEKVFCDAQSGRCLNADEGRIYYYDDDHVSNTGARLMMPVIVDAIEASLAD